MRPAAHELERAVRRPAGGRTGWAEARAGPRAGQGCAGEVGAGLKIEGTSDRLLESSPNPLQYPLTPKP